MAKKKKAKKKKVTKKKTTRKKTTKKKKAKKKAARGTWPAKDVAVLKRMFPTNPTSKIAKKLGRKTDAVKKKASRLGLKKDKKYLKSIGRA
jgi:hypothetical protein